MKTMSLRYCNYFIPRISVLFSVILSPALAGPPFRTDDPQPVDFHHWEFYVASMQQIVNNQTSATLPHFEINYGVIPDVQIHLVAPLEYIHSSNVAHYGYSDTEIGLKYRFVEETETTPQIGFFPLVEFPTGDNNKQLGSGKVLVYIPVWIQKSWGKWTTYGGGGFWYNPVPDQKNWIFTGWELQYDFSKVFTLGGELCCQTANVPDSKTSGSINLGGFINFDDTNHLLFSCGHSFSGNATITGYIGYQLTI
jgi:hypothetical protein